VTAKGADNLEIFPVENGYVITEDMAESDVVAAVKFEFLSLEFAQYLP
jgi:hypothetical protein